MRIARSITSKWCVERWEENIRVSDSTTEPCFGERLDIESMEVCIENILFAEETLNIVVDNV